MPIGTVGPFLMVSGFRKDAPTVAVVMASFTASPMSSIKTAVRNKHQTYTLYVLLLAAKVDHFPINHDFMVDTVFTLCL